MQKLIFLVISFLLLPLCQALELDYPELHVEPSASSRILSGAKRETRKSMGDVLPLYLSGLTTFAAGIGQFDSYDRQDPSNKDSAYVGIGIGLIWISAAAYLQRSYQPYLKTYAQIKDIKGTSKRLRLRKERLAEEGMTRAYRTYRVVKWMAFITQAAAGSVMANSAKEDSSLGGEITILTSIFPLLFDHFWTENYWLHQKNKKNIYAPLVGSILQKSPRDQRYGLALSWNF